MEDVEDGIKVSIQDGVTEDPEFLEKLDTEGKSFIGLIYISEEITSPQITSVVDTHSSNDISNLAITTVLGTAVT